MTRDDLYKLPRPAAVDLQGASAAQIENGLNIAWWRGYYAAVDQSRALEEACAELEAKRLQARETMLWRETDVAASYGPKNNA